MSPTGFVSDHLEVAWDLDTEARATAESLGIAFARAATAGTHPAFVSMVRELVVEEIAGRAACVARAAGHLRAGLPGGLLRAGSPAGVSAQTSAL